jgi:ribosomal protein S12 methylthiotransferase
LIQALNIDYKSELQGQRLLSTPKHYAYLKISEGCNRTCSFCAIPMIRGRYISRSISDLVKESVTLAKNGVKELLVIAQDTTYYGIDSYKKHKIAELLGKLSEIEEIEWIRLHYAYPTGFPEELIDLIASNHKLCKYLDIPFQHVCERILKSMRRSHTKKDIIRLVDLSRRMIRDLAIRTTFIVGYPGETDKEFAELYDFIKEVKFERLGVFNYSHEEGTSAYKLKDDIPARIKEERYNEIMKLQRDISFENNQKMINKEIKVIIDRKESGFWVGRSMHDSPEIDNEVLLSDKKNDNLTGKIVNTKITDFENYDLFGKII